MESITRFTVFAVSSLALLSFITQRLANKKQRPGNTSEPQEHSLEGITATKVYLVGAGPGAADLISVRGLEIIKKADIVLNDRLVSPELLTYCKSGCEILNVGKSSEKDRFAQKDLEHELLTVAREAKNGSIVVRLKGGDPYIYGLGASEGLMLEEAGIAWEYVPGLSSAISLPGLCLRTPLTHKGVSAGFIVLSGHVAPTVDSEWGQLPRCSEPKTTLVVIMCAKNLASITQFLRMELGWSPNLPAAVIQSGSTKDERTVRSSLNTIAAKTAYHGMDEAPLALVIGKALEVLPTVDKSLAGSMRHSKTSTWGVPREDGGQEQEWWVFGYGSLIWKTSEDVPHTHVEDGYIEGFVRRFWQSSPDHRGTESNPGRVVTIVPLEAARALTRNGRVFPEKVFGRIFQVEPDKIDQTRGKLEHREKAGYEEMTVDVVLKSGKKVKASVFLASPENDHFVGPEEPSVIAQKIHQSVGPSGENIEYFDELFAALSDMQKRWGETDRVVDGHILDIARQLSHIRNAKRRASS